MRRRLPQWQGEIKCRPFLRGAFYLQFAVVVLNNLSGDGKPQAGAFRAAARRIRHLMKFIENIFLVGFADSDAIVCDGNDQLIGTSFEADINFAKSRVAKFDGVGNQIHHRLNQLIAIPINRRRC